MIVTAKALEIQAIIKLESLSAKPHEGKFCVKILL